MAFWSSEKLLERLQDGLLIAPFDSSRVKHGAYELSLGSETIITSVAGEGTQFWSDGHKPIIPPGQIAMLITHERVSIPPDAIAFISIKATKKFGGLINISGFHVDPGFNGRLKFSVYNAGSAEAALDVGQPTFLIWFCNLDRSTEDPYDGSHQGQARMSAEDVRRLRGEIASPAALSARIDRLHRDLERRITKCEDRLSVRRTVLMVLLGAVAGAILGVLFKPLSRGEEPAASQGSVSTSAVSLDAHLSEEDYSGDADPHADERGDDQAPNEVYANTLKEGG